MPVDTRAGGSSGEGRFGGQTPAKTCNCTLLLPPGEFKRGVWRTCRSERFRLLPNVCGPC